MVVEEEDTGRGTLVGVCGVGVCSFLIVEAEEAEGERGIDWVSLAVTTDSATSESLSSWLDLLLPC